jgi:hypothetical protein
MEPLEAAMLPWAHRDALQTVVSILYTPNVFNNLGICFSLKANPNPSNQKSFGTVLARYDQG